MITFPREDVILASIATFLAALLAFGGGRALGMMFNEWRRRRRARKAIERVIKEAQKGLPPMPREPLVVPSLWLHDRFILPNEWVQEHFPVAPMVTPHYPEIVVAHDVPHFIGCYNAFTPEYPEACSCPPPFGNPKTAKDAATPADEGFDKQA